MPENENYLKNEAMVVHDVKGIDPLLDLPLLSSLEALTKAWPADVNAYGEGRADEVNAKSLDKDKALELFKVKRSGLFFDDPDRFSPLIADCLQELKEDLGLSNLTYSRSLIYAIAKGQGTDAHFDQNINFVLQIKGSKKWWLSKNESVQNPLERHTIGEAPSAELQSYSPEFPSEFPEKSNEITLERGSLLFLPRGTWHKTLANSDSISLNFTYSAPAWVDIFLAALRSRLVQSKDWRETANFVNDPDLYKHAVEKFDHLLKDLSEDSKSWKAYEILKSTET